MGKSVEMLYSMQAARGVAALFVLFFHLAGSFSSDTYFGSNGFIQLFCFGDTGVEFFFVLSGFIISKTHFVDIGRTEMLWNYTSKRISRVYPIYWCVFSVVSVAAMYVGTAGARVPNNALEYLSASLLLPQPVTGFDGTGAAVLVVAWTLQYEVLFYLLFGVAIFSGLLGLVIAVMWLICWGW